MLSKFCLLCLFCNGWFFPMLGVISLLLVVPSPSGFFVLFLFMFCFVLFVCSFLFVCLFVFLFFVRCNCIV